MAEVPIGATGDQPAGDRVDVRAFTGAAHRIVFTVSRINN